MHFVHPYMFWWLFAMAIPVIVHLFNFRRHRTLLFSDVRLLRDLQQRTNKQRKLKQLLILFARMLAIAMLVFSFARPYIKRGDAPGEGLKYVNVYLDNSISMQLRAEQSSLLDEMRAHALSLPGAFRLDDRFSLITNDFLPRHQVFLSGDEFRQEVSQVRDNAPGVNIGQVLQRVQNTLPSNTATQSLLYLLSDFQRNALQFDKVLADSNLRIFLVEGKALRPENISLDSCWLENPILLPGQLIVFQCSITNRGKDNVEGLPLSLSVEGVQKAVATVDIPAGKQTTASLNFVPEKAGTFRAVASVLDDAIAFDDELYLTFEVRDAIPVLEIYEQQPNIYLQLLFGNDPLVRFSSAPRLKLDVQMLEMFQTIFLSGLSEINSGLTRALEQFVRSGGNLVIFPSEKSNLATATFAQQFEVLYSLQPDTMQTRVQTLQIEHPLLNGALTRIPENADLPLLKKWYSLSIGQAKTAQIPIALLNGGPLLVCAEVGRGYVFAYAVPMEASWTNLMNNNLFVVLMYRSLLLSKRDAGLYHQLDGPVLLDLGAYLYNENLPLQLRSDDGRLSLMPEITALSERRLATVYPELVQPGFYGLFSGDSLLKRLAINASRKESVMDFATAEEVKKMLEEKGFKHVQVIQPDMRGLGSIAREWLDYRPIHYIFIWLALFFLMVEVLIIRFFR